MKRKNPSKSYRKTANVNALEMNAHISCIANADRVDKKRSKKKKLNIGNRMAKFVSEKSTANGISSKTATIEIYTRKASTHNVFQSDFY